MIVKDIMSSYVVTASINDTVSSAAKLMSKHNIGAIPVTEGDTLKGIITDRDIVLRCVANGTDTNSCKVGNIMTSSAACISPNQDVTDAVKLMANEQIRRVPVLENGKIQGIVTLADIARIRHSTEISAALTEISMP